MAEKSISAEALVDLMIKKWNDQPKKDDSQVLKQNHLQALDDLVNVNSLFTVAVFVGLSLATPGQRSLDNHEECQTNSGYGKMLIVYEVIAFACFLLSSLVAKVLKLHLYMDGKRYDFVRSNLDLKDVMLAVVAIASVAGIVLLTLSVINIIQIRLGLLSCGSTETKSAVWGLVAIVGLALVIYVSSMCIAIVASYRSDVVFDGVEKSMTGIVKDPRTDDHIGVVVLQAQNPST